MSSLRKTGIPAGRKYNIITYGCQMNEHDSEIIAGMLREEGFVEAQPGEAEDITVINTCSIRENADRRFFGKLGQFKARKKQDPDYMLCVCGCMMQQEHIIDTIKKSYPWVDVIFGTHNIHRLPELLGEAYEKSTKIIETFEDSSVIEEGMPSCRTFEHKAFVNIMFGCNNFCTYCVVPHTRGREKSRSPENIVQEVRALVDDGVKEITLLGQNVNSYRGVDEDGSPCDFTDLIYRIDRIEGLERLRFMTSHPKDLSDRLIQAFADCRTLCRYIHLPVQSGSNDVLRRMNRRYTREHYLEVAAKLRKTVPDITVSTDLIVGFPGETEEDFEQTLDLVRQMEYDSAFTFMYSVRPGTPAASFEDQIPEEVKHERFERLVDAVNEGSARRNAVYEGRIEKVLVEGFSRKNTKAVSGRTEGFKLVDFEGGYDLIGKIVDVEIIEAKTFSMWGRLVCPQDI